MEFRWANGQYDRLPALAADLVRRKVSVIITMGGGPPVQAARMATSTIPIVFHLGADPVQVGLVVSLARPGGNITGVTLMTNLLEPKRLELLHKMVPNAKSIGVLVNPANPQNAFQVRQLQEAARAVQLNLVIVYASTAAQLEASFGSMVANQIDALTVLSDVFFTLRELGQLGAWLRDCRDARSKRSQGLSALDPLCRAILLQCRQADADPDFLFTQRTKLPFQVEACATILNRVPAC